MVGCDTSKIFSVGICHLLALILKREEAIIPLNLSSCLPQVRILCSCHLEGFFASLKT